VSIAENGRALSAPWHILTGEYPPKFGGVSDYSAQVANGLAQAGIEVHVWTPGQPATSDGVTVHPADWSAAGLARLDQELNRFPIPRRLLIQYFPNAWGRKGLNFGFVRWLRARKERGDDVRTMLHELWYRPEPWDRPQRYLLIPAHRWMMGQILKASSCVYASIPAWEEMLKPYRFDGPIRWLPVPSNIPVVGVDVTLFTAHQPDFVRGKMIIGTFGTFREEIAPALRVVVPRLASNDRVCVALIGQNSDEFGASLTGDGLWIGVGAVSSEEVSLQLKLSDILIQPYRGGVSSRRGTIMAGLAHGKPIVTTSGPLTEPIWSESRAVVLVPDGDTDAFVAAVERLMNDPDARERLGNAARATYLAHFAAGRTIEGLLSD
jgi:glycosyltransferase involved in cell wall biosynthesis